MVLAHMTPAFICPFTLTFAKGKKDKTQKSRGNPDTAEAYMEIHRSCTNASTKRHGAVFGTEVPATSTPHVGRSANRTSRICMVTTWVTAHDIPHHSQTLRSCHKCLAHWRIVLPPHAFWKRI